MGGQTSSLRSKAPVVKLVDTSDLGSDDRKILQVRVLPGALFLGLITQLVRVVGS